MTRLPESVRSGADPAVGGAGPLPTGYLRVGLSYDGTSNHSTVCTRFKGSTIFSTPSFQMPFTMILVFRRLTYFKVAVARCGLL